MESDSLFSPQFIKAEVLTTYIPSPEERLEKFLSARSVDEPLDPNSDSLCFSSANSNQIAARDLLVYGFNPIFHRHLFDNQMYVFINCYLVMQWCIDVLCSDIKSRPVATDLWIRFLSMIRFDYVNNSVFENPEYVQQEESTREIVIHVSDFLLFKDAFTDITQIVDVRYPKFEHAILSLLKRSYDSHSVDDKQFSDPSQPSMFVYLHYMRQQEKRSSDSYIKNSEVVDPFLRLHGADENGLPIKYDKILNPKTVILGDAAGTPIIVEDLEIFQNKKEKVNSNVVCFKQTFDQHPPINDVSKNINDLTNPQKDSSVPKDILRARLQQKLKSTKERR